MQVWIQQFRVGAWESHCLQAPRRRQDTSSSDHTLNSKGEDHARNLDFILSETGKKLLKGFKQVSDVNPVIVKITLVS